jgi:hypothetical protein
MNKNIGISFGALSQPLSKQLKSQGFKFNPDKIKTFEKEIDAINQLRFGSNLLTDSMVDKLIQKLYKKIVSHVAKENKLKVVNP